MKNRIRLGMADIASPLEVDASADRRIICNR